MGFESSRRQRTDFHLRVPTVVAESAGKEALELEEVLEKPVQVDSAGKLW